MLKYFIISAIQIFAIPMFCNNDSIINSLKRSLPLVSSDSAKVDILNELSWQYRNIDYKIAKNYAIQGIELSKQIGYRKGMVDAQNRLGIAYKNNGEYEESIKIYEAVLVNEEEALDTFGIARVSYQIANVYEKTGDYEKALKYLGISLAMFQKLNDYTNISKTQNLIGGIYLFQSQYDQALSYFLQALEIRIAVLDSIGIANSQLNIGLLYQNIENYEKSQQYLTLCIAFFERTNYKKGLAKCYNNMGTNLFYLGKYDEARHYYDKSLQLKTALNDQNALAYTYLNLGNISLYLKKIDLSLEYYKQALFLFKEHNNKRGLATINLNIGSIYVQKGDPKKAIKYLQEGYKLSKELNDLFLQIEILKSLSASLVKQGMLEEAITYNKTYDRLKDSLTTIYKNTINYKTKYEEEQQKIVLAEKDKQIKMARLKRTQLINYILVSGVIFLIIFIVILIIFFKQQHRRVVAEKNLKINQQKINVLLKNTELKSTYAKLEGQDQERKRIAQDLHDRLGSTLSTIKLYFSAVESKLDVLMEENREQYNKANQLLDKASDEVHRIANDMNSGLLTKFGLLAELKDLAETIEETTILKVNIIESGFASRLNIVLEGKIYRIIQELVSNVLKHANAHVLNIQVTRYNGTLNIIVEDDGIGFDYNLAIKKNGLGLKNIESRVLDLGGELNIDSGKGAGTTVSIDINIDKNI